MTIIDSQDRISWACSAHAMKETAQSSHQHLISGLLPAKSVIVFAGEPGSGKSFTALSWAASIAGGLPWFGREVQEPSPVVYVLGEGWGSFGKRIEAWENKHDQPMSENLYFVDGIARGLDLTSTLSVDGFIEHLLEIGPSLVIFDTFSMLALVRSENDNAEVAGAFANLNRIAREVETSVLVIHHVSKASGELRGATAFKANADTVVMVARSTVKSEETFALSTRTQDGGKQRDSEPLRMTGFFIDDSGVLDNDSHVSKVEEAREGVLQAVANLFQDSNTSSKAVSD